MLKHTTKGVLCQICTFGTQWTWQASLAKQLFPRLSKLICIMLRALHSAALKWWQCAPRSLASASPPALAGPAEPSASSFPTHAAQGLARTSLSPANTASHLPSFPGKMLYHHLVQPHPQPQRRRTRTMSVEMIFRDNICNFNTP